MRKPEREASRWFVQALDDYRFVKWVNEEKRFFDKGCFIAQQAGEKALKACLYAMGERRVIGHSLFEMLSELMARDDEFRSILEECKRLDRFYIPTRYPNGLPGGSPFEVYTKKELDEAMLDLTAVIHMAEKFLITKGVKSRLQ